MTQGQLCLPDGTCLAVDNKGYLLDPAEWTPLFAEHLARLDGLMLTSDHWVVLDFFREYFLTYDIDPPMRALVKQAREKLGEEKGNSRYLYRLFPAGPATQACRYAGLPRPISCI